MRVDPACESLAGLSKLEVEPGDVIGNVPIDTILTVVDGPRTANGLTWWLVRYSNASGKLITGWMADASTTGEPILAPAMP